MVVMEDSGAQQVARYRLLAHPGMIRKLLEDRNRSQTAGLKTKCNRATAPAMESPPNFLGNSIGANNREMKFL
jgi:hypothetical protein